VENRAEKMITKFEDPNAAPNRAPMYKSDAQVLEDVRRDNPELLEEMVTKDDKLLDRLKTVYVSSSDAQPEPELNPDKPLPIDVRQHYVDFVPSQMRMERPGGTRILPRGKVSLDQAMEFLGKHSQTEGKYGAPEISEEYRLNQEVVTNTLKHFNIFSMMETKTREDESVRPDPLSAGPDWEYPAELVDPSKPQRESRKEDGEKLRLAGEAAKERQEMRVEEEKKKKLQLKD